MVRLVSDSQKHYILNPDQLKDAKTLPLRRVTNLLIVLGGIAVQANNTFLSTTMMPSISEDLGVVSMIFWPMVSSLSVSIIGAAITPLVTSHWGRNRAYLLMFLLYSFGTVGAALAKDFSVFTVFRGVQGFAGGMLVALSYALIPVLFDNDKVGKVFALTSVVWGAAALVGPLLGAHWIDLNLWRIGLCCLLPLLLIVVGLVISSTHLLRGTEPVPASLNWATLMLLIAAIFAIAMSAGNTTPEVKYTALCLGIAVFVWSLYRDSVSKSSIFPSIHHSQPSFPKLATFMMFVLCCANSSISIYIPVVVQRVFESSVLVAGYFHSLEAIAWSIAAICASYFAAVKPLTYIRAGTLAMTLGMFVLAFSLISASFVLAIIAIALCGGGIGMFWSHATSIVVNNVDSNLAERASSSLSTVQLLAYGFSAALSGSIVNLTDPSTLQISEYLAVGSQNLFLTFGVFSLISFCGACLVKPDLSKITA